MSIKLGNRIPERVIRTLDSKNPRRAATVIFMISTDPYNFPHIALLSPFQVIIEDSSSIYFSVYKNSSTHDYIVKNKIFTLILQDMPALLYIKCRIITAEIENEEYDEIHHFFKAEPIEILRDASEKAPITSEMLFDTDRISADYMQEFVELSQFIEKLRNGK